MEESRQIKEFKSKDVQRMRNIISKNGDDATGVQIGYTKTNIKRKEGDTWEENDKTWTIKNGIKISISKLDAVKKALFIPFTCPECGKPLKNYLDKKMYGLSKKCLDCVIEYESKLKREGTYGEYEKEKFNKNLDLFIKDIELEALDFILNGRESMITETGEIENWQESDNSDQIKEGIKKYIDELKKLYI